MWRYRNGVFGMIATGQGMAMIGADNRLLGSEGVIEVGVKNRGPLLRIQRRGSAEWEEIDTNGENLHGPGFINRSIASAVEALEAGREPELSGRHALNATEIIFAIYESSRRRARVDLPLRIDDNPLVSMVRSGDLQPEPPPA
jgi:UDP-N-acetylglucosamine 3-dehydrogenase